MAQDYVFRSMTTADLPLVQRWLSLPHVREWWGDPLVETPDGTALLMVRNP